MLSNFSKYPHVYITYTNDLRYIIPSYGKYNVLTLKWIILAQLIIHSLGVFKNIVQGIKYHKFYSNNKYVFLT